MHRSYQWEDCCVFFLLALANRHRFGSEVVKKRIWNLEFGSWKLEEKSNLQLNGMKLN